MGAETVRDGLHDHIAVLERPEGSRTQPENRQEERRHQVAYNHEGADRRPRVHQAYGGEGPQPCNAQHVVFLVVSFDPTANRMGRIPSSRAMIIPANFEQPVRS